MTNPIFQDFIGHLEERKITFALDEYAAHMDKADKKDNYK